MKSEIKRLKKLMPTLKESMNNTEPTTTKIERRGGRRAVAHEVKLDKIKKVSRILAGGYGMEIACRRVSTSSCTIRKWAKELGIKFNY